MWGAAWLSELLPTTFNVCSLSPSTPGSPLRHFLRIIPENNRCFKRDGYMYTYWRQEEKGTTEDEMVGWHHRLDGHGFE